MGWRGPTALAVLALLGGALGYGASLASGSTPAPSGVASPVVAEGALSSPEPDPDPEPEVVVKDDPDDPALQPGIELERVTMGSERFAVSFLVPEGWNRIDRASNEWKWKKPGTSNNTYVLAVEQVTSRRLTVEQSKEAATTRLAEDQDQFEPRPSDADALDYTYISDEGTRRHSFIRWVGVLRGDQADVEIVVHGRKVDVPGTSELADRIAESVTAG